MTAVLLNWPPSDLLEVRSNRFLIRSLREADVSECTLKDFKKRRFKASFPDFPTSSSIQAFAKLHCLEARPSIRTLAIWNEAQIVGYLWVKLDAKGDVVQTHNYVSEDKWLGLGVIHEARAALIEAMFRLGAAKIFGLPRHDNSHAIRCYREQGFVQEGILRSHYKSENGRTFDAIAFGMLKAEWNLEVASRLPKR